MISNIRFCLLAALAILGSAMLLHVFGSYGLIDGNVGERIFMATLGLMVAAFGNAIPKVLKAPRVSLSAERRTQAAKRRAGWAMVLAGSIYASAWVVAPEEWARPVSLSVLGLAFAYTIVQIFQCRHGAAPQI